MENEKVRFTAWLIDDYDVLELQAYVIDDGITDALINKADIRCIDSLNPQVGKCYTWEIDKAMAIEKEFNRWD